MKIYELARVIKGFNSAHFLDQKTQSNGDKPRNRHSLSKNINDTPGFEYHVNEQHHEYCIQDE